MSVIAVLVSNIVVATLAVYLVLQGHPAFAVFLCLVGFMSVKTRRS